MEKQGRTLITSSGKRYPITGETGRYYLCGETQFRKSGPQIAKIERETRRKKAEEREEEA